MKKITSIQQAALSALTVNRSIALVVAVVVIGGVSYLGVHTKQASKAATGTATLSLSPSTNKYHIGDTIPVVIQANSPTAMSTVEAALTYPSSLLKFTGVTEGSAFTVQARTTSTTAGALDLIRSLPGGTAGITGSSTIITVNFQVIAAGPATIALTSASGIYDSSAGVDVYDAANSHGSTYTLLEPAPTVSSVSPSSGFTSGGGSSPVTITGTGFVVGATVTFGTTTGTTPVIVSSTNMTVIPPAHAAGTVSVIVINPDGQAATLSNGYVYGNPAPVVSSVTPASGLISGTTNVTITGSGFMAPLAVSVGGVAATNVTLVSSTAITATVPAHASGSVDIVVINGDGQSVTKTAAYTYTNPAPTVSSISPTGGSVGGGTVVTISGTNFVSGATVSIGGNPATGVSTTGTMITATAPAHTSGIVDVKVQNPDGLSVTKTASFTYATAGDANNDGHVNSLDLSLLLSHDGQNYPASDFNHDGTVGAADLAILLSNWTW
jgi:hypothetical protein